MTGKKNLFFLPAYGLTITLLFLLFSANISFAQEYSKLDSLKIGAKYKIILFDDTEIIGTVISIDSDYVTINTGVSSKRIRKDDIFNISKDLTPSRYGFMFSAGGGISIMTGGFFNEHYSDFSTLYSLQMNAVFVESGTRAFRFDLGYSRFKRKQIYEFMSDFQGGDLGMFCFKGDFMFGDFKPSSAVNPYGSVGLGIHLLMEDKYSYNVYNSWDSSYNSYSNPIYKSIDAVLSVGAGVGFRFNKHLGAYAEIQYNMITYGGGFLFFGFGTGYFPMRVGITYYLY